MNVVHASLANFTFSFMGRIINRRELRNQSAATRDSMTEKLRKGFSKGLLDTSLVIDHDLIDTALLPDESAISAVTLAELAAGPHATQDTHERARRQDRLQWASLTWDSLPFDAEAARAYGRMFAAARPPDRRVVLGSRCGVRFQRRCG
jgi:hypothetical protein